MRIVGSGSKVLDADLLSKLAVSSQSGNTVSKAEVQNAISSAKNDLKDEFDWRDSSAGLTKHARAVANTLNLAVESGWVKGGQAKELIAAFVSGDGAGSLDALKDEIKADIKENRDSSVGYGGSSSSVSYSGGSSYSSHSSSYTGT